MVRLPALKFDRDDPRLKKARRLVEAAGRMIRDQLRHEWNGSPPHRWSLALPVPRGQAAGPRDRRPPDPRRGQGILEGRFVFDGLELDTGLGASPWNRPSPSRAFAEALHGMDWLADVLVAKPETGVDADAGGARTALSLVLGWHQVFGRWNVFSWSLPVLERRVFNLACALRPLLAEASPAERSTLLLSLARQARHLLRGDGDPSRAAEQACAAAVAACALGGRAGDGLRGRALARLEKTLPITVLPDGGHASRSPDAGLELLLDLQALDGALDQLGKPAPAAVAGAIDRLAAALRFFTLADGRLPGLQGSEEGDPIRIAAALEGREPAPGAARPMSAPNAGYELLASRRLQVLVDAGAPAAGAWSQLACAQPCAMVVLAGQARLIGSSAWSPRSGGAQALRLTPAASTACISDDSCGAPLQGRLARIFGFRLADAPETVRMRRQDAEGAAGVELAHDGWSAYGLTHQRRLYLDARTDELRGEDLLQPIGGGPPPARVPGRRPVFLTVRFQLHPEVKASLALDHKSVLLQPKSGGGWWLRNDAPEVAIEPAVHMQNGRPHATHQVVMRILLNREGLARIRWKLGAA